MDCVLGDVVIVDFGRKGLINVLVVEQQRESKRGRQVDVHLSYDMEDTSSSFHLDRRHSCMWEVPVQSHAESRPHGDANERVTCGEVRCRLQEQNDEYESLQRRHFTALCEVV